ncbi:PREDICTED: probable protein BRICK1 [Nelumbo nucifera]|uniref:Probable protein BRICK1 n=1 Tax=Nelumbo nucifera TaxID=4432 RepID=A0A1U8QB94_NELNU|nr:PREDICTED: probable protein BRICK1 [Nelumbo nucifera]
MSGTMGGTSTPHSLTSKGEPSNSGSINIQMITDFITRLDEAAKRRLDSMNQKLRDMERQMEALETNIKNSFDGA